MGHEMKDRWYTKRLLLVAFVGVAIGAANAAFADGNLLLWDGEEPTTCNYGSLNTTQEFRGTGCFEGVPDAYHQPVISLSGLASWRADLSNYDEIWFFAKSNQEGKTFGFSIYGWPNTSNSVNIDNYIEGNHLTTTYRLARIPLAVLKTATFPVDKTESLQFGNAKPSPGHKIYIDEVWAVHLDAVDPDRTPLMGALPSLDYGDVAVGTSKTLEVSVSNIGKGPLEVSQVTFSDGPPSEFEATPTQFTVGPGQDQKVRITFAPRSPAEKSVLATLLHTNTVMGNSSTISLRARATGAAAVLSADSLDFGSAAVGQGISWPLGITNAGNQELVVDQVSAGSEPFTAPAESIHIGAGESREMLVTFLPTAEAAATGHLTFNTNDINKPTVSVNLSGQGIPASGGTPYIPVRVDKVTSSTVGLTFPAAASAQEVRVYIAPEPAADAVTPLPGQYAVAQGLPGTTTQYTIQNLAAAVDVFIHVEVRDGHGVVTAGSAHARTVGGPRTDLATPLREVHLFAPNILMLVIDNKYVNSYTGTSGSLVGYTGPEWQAGPWTVVRRDGSPMTVRNVYRHSICVGQPYYEGGVGAPLHETYVDVDHRIYLVLDSNVGNLDVLHVQGPSGMDVLVPYSDKYLETPVIQVNQVGYSPRAAQRFAYLSGWMGDGGALSLDNFPTTAEVLVDPEDPMEPRTQVGSDFPINLRAANDPDMSAPVKHIDLAGLPPAEGVVYRVRVPGVGVSWQTQVSETAVFKAFFTMIRALYFERWGRDLQPQWTEWSSHPPDHPTIYTAERVDAQGNAVIGLFFSPDTPKVGERPLSGGHHNAGDFDVRIDDHTIALFLMRLYEVRPDAFTDGQSHFPESGNGIPDVLDEALYNLHAWEQLQEEDGGCRAGAESYGHPHGIYFADEDPLPFWTYSRHTFHTLTCAGLFAQAARLVQPFDAARSSELLARAIKAYDYAISKGAGISARGLMFYASGELFRMTGEQRYLDMFNATYQAENVYGDGPDVRPSIPNAFDAVPTINGNHLVGYLTGRNANPTYVSQMTTRITRLADAEVNSVASSHAHRNGRAVGGTIDWGHGTVVGEYIMAIPWRCQLGGLSPAKQQAYFDAMSLSADYILGCNPSGMAWVTGLGSRHPEDPLHLDSLMFIKQGMGPIPGFPVFGPTRYLSGLPYYDYAENVLYPAFAAQPLMLHYMDTHMAVTNSEGGGQMMALNAQLFGMLIATGMMPPASWLPGGKEHRNPLAPREGIGVRDDVTPPNPGSVSAPAFGGAAPIVVNYSGAMDAGSGLKSVELWVKKGATGTWQDSGLRSTGASGSFSYTGMSGDDTYYFATLAEDNVGNRSAAPFGSGTGHTVVDTTPPNPGTVQAPAATNVSPITVTYSGVTDGGSGIKEVRLWVKKGKQGAWENTGLKCETAPLGSFSYTGVAQEGPYYFFLQAVDKAGTVSAEPTDQLVFSGGQP